MPRSPLVTAATRELAKYFKATTDAAFIDRSWKIKAETSKIDNRIGTTGVLGIDQQLSSFGKIYKASEEYESGTPVADHIANFLNGALSVGEFQRVVEWPRSDEYAEQLEIYQLLKDYVLPGTTTPANYMFPVTDKFPSNPPKGSVTLYAANVFNPYMGPMTKDVGSLEIFMNAIPTLEFSRCMPYLSVEVISLNRTSGTVAPPLTLIGFLNPDKLSTADSAMIGAQRTTVRSEVKDLGAGLVSGMELFTAPQTLVNLGAIGKEFVPTIDRLRPLASLGNLSLSTKIQGGTLSFTTGRLEITIHDRSRLREMAAFVRPDLYGTTFLDITYGWSHPEGGVTSKNSYGKFLDALKHTSRFRIAGSTYAFEEGGQIKVTMNIQTVGTTDLLYVTPAGNDNAIKKLQDVIRRLNELLVDIRARSTTPSMAEYDFLSAFQDPSSAMSASLDKDVLKKIRDLIKKIPQTSELAKVLNDLVGANDLSKDAKKPGDGSAIDAAQDALTKSYEKSVKEIPTFKLDEFGKVMLSDDPRRFASMFDNTLYTDVEGSITQLTSETGTRLSGVGLIKSASNKQMISDSYVSDNDYISYGSAFMNLIAKPIAETGQYDEVQVIFYPFNKYAGAVHDLPISAFPMERPRFLASIQDLARRSPNVSARQIIGMMYDRFTHFLPARAYLMAGFYDQSKAEDGTVESKSPKDVFTFKNKRYAASPQLTHEKRLINVGIPEARFTLPVVQVAVEGAPLLDAKGDPLNDENGNQKSIIKIHVYDSAMDPHSTITDLVRSAKDSELNVVTIPVATLNSSIRVSGKTYVDSSSVARDKAMEVIKAGEAAGLLQAISVDSGEEAKTADNPVEEMKNNNVFYRVKGDYVSIKELVTTSVPTIVYGSSTSAMTNASLQSNTSPGLGNVQLLRAFTEPGEVRAESLNTGVPMLVVPAQLSISTIGCPLFSPMQRLFIDFGTGTSIDNLYHVISFDSTIGKDGFKTDVKLGFADGFASYRSLNQNLALLAYTLKGDTTESTTTSLPVSLTSPDIPIVDPNKLIEETKKEVRQGLVNLAMPIAQLEADTKARIARELAVLQAKLAAKVEKEKQELQAKAEALVPAEVRAAAVKAQQDAAIALATVKEKAEPVIRAAILGKDFAALVVLASTLPAGVGEALISEALLAVEAARSQAAANTKVT